MCCTVAGEAVASLTDHLHQVVGQISTSQRQRAALFDRHGVGHTITRFHHNTCEMTGGIQRQDGLHAHVQQRSVEGLEHDLEQRERRQEQTETLQ